MNKAFIHIFVFLVLFLLLPSHVAHAHRKETRDFILGVQCSDGYSYNLNMQIPEEYRTLQSLIKSSQRATLQAGLNLFMCVAGLSVFFSLRKRRNNLFSTMVERSFKLLFGFVFGMIAVAIPSNIIILYCELGEFPDIKEYWLPLLSPGHIAFLPYLFVLSQILVPITATMVNCGEYFLKVGKDVTSIHVPKHIWAYAMLWSLAYLFISGVTLHSAIMFGILMVGIICHGFTKMINLWTTTVERIYAGISQSNNGMFITLYTFMVPLVVLFVSRFLLPHLEFSEIGLTMIFVVPLLTCFWDESFLPFGSYMPYFHVNTSFMAILSVVFGQLFNITNPHHLPMFPVAASEAGIYWIEDVTDGIVTERILHAILIMGIAHTAYYMCGFYMIFFRNVLPSLPVDNLVFNVFMAIYYITLHVLSVSPSKDFFFITPGYVTYHIPWRRFWYHFGGWSWVGTLLGVLRYLSNKPLEGNRWDVRVIKFLSDNTFGTFFIHPLAGYVFCCLLKDLDINIVTKIVILDVGVYVFSYAWSHYMKKIPIVQKLFGTEKNAK